MTGIDFDFARYIDGRRGVIERRARDGSAYAYSGERKVRRTLSSARPVVMAIEATTRLWKNVAKTELLGTAVKATDQEFPQLFAATQKAAASLRMEPPSVYVIPAQASTIRAQVLGTNDDAYVVINSQLLERLSATELRALIGHELGHIQNNHVLYTTSLHYLTHAAAMFVRWVVQPAIMTLQAWSRRAEITCDRAALLCTCDLDVTLSALIKVALELDSTELVDVQSYLAQLPESDRGVGRYTELFRSHPYLPKRIQALQLFAESALYQTFTGAEAADAPGIADVDTQVGEILSVF